MRLDQLNKLDDFNLKDIKFNSVQGKYKDTPRLEDRKKTVQSEWSGHIVQLKTKIVSKQVEVEVDRNILSGTHIFVWGH